MKAVALLAVTILGVIACAYAQSTAAPTPSPWFQCTNGDGFYANPYDCEKYFMCYGGYAWEFHCPAKLWFNTDISACDFQDNVVCTATPTMAPTEAPKM